LANFHVTILATEYQLVGFTKGRELPLVCTYGPKNSSWPFPMTGALSNQLAKNFYLLKMKKGAGD
jgi:hypothetical protein